MAPLIFAGIACVLSVVAVGFSGKTYFYNKNRDDAEDKARELNIVLDNLTYFANMLQNDKDGRTLIEGSIDNMVKYIIYAVSTYHGDIRVRILMSQLFVIITSIKANHIDQNIPLDVSIVDQNKFDKVYTLFNRTRRSIEDEYRLLDEAVNQVAKNLWDTLSPLNRKVRVKKDSVVEVVSVKGEVFKLTTLTKVKPDMDGDRIEIWLNSLIGDYIQNTDKEYIEVFKKELINLCAGEYNRSVVYPDLKDCSRRKLKRYVRKGKLTNLSEDFVSIDIKDIWYIKIHTEVCEIK